MSFKIKLSTQVSARLSVHLFSHSFIHISTSKVFIIIVKLAFQVEATHGSDNTLSAVNVNWFLIRRKIFNCLIVVIASKCKEQSLGVFLWKRAQTLKVEIMKKLHQLVF